MKVIVSAGGTGGHIYPALAIINKIKQEEPNSEFLYIGTHNRMEKDIIPNHNIPYRGIEVYGFFRDDLFRNFMVIKKLWLSFFESKKIIKNFNPDIVIGVGGYVTVPVIMAAFTLRYKTFIHEQNSVPGAANKFLSKFATLIGVSFESSLMHFPKHKTHFTGNPCSEDAINITPALKEEFGLNPSSKLVYIVMGSLGASKLNETLIKTLPLFENKNYEVVFVTGKNSYEEVAKNIYPSNVKLFPYIENQTRLLKKADLVVTRCGASTLSELIALEKPSILIPSPNVTNNHQYKNGIDLIKQDAAYMIEERSVTPKLLVETIDNILNDEVRLNKMKSGLKGMHVPQSATKIYNIIKNR